jgi:uncharacterized protein (TIGR03437 family)
MKRFIGLLILLAGVANAAIPQSERDALIAFYNSTNGDSWTTKTNWKSAGIFSAAGTECTWYGITCTGGAVTGIILPTNSLTGSIPSLTGLPNLQEFAVSSNQLTGIIPALTGLTNLQHFWVGSNKLTGSIPALTGLTNLSFFDVYSNQLTGIIPALTGLTSLGAFYVYANQLTGAIPSLTGLTNLVDFQVYSNQLTGSIPALTGLTSLKYFGANFNQVTGSIPALTGLTSLKSFDVYSNQLTGIIPALTGLTSLEEFYLYSNQLTGAIPSLTGLMNLGRFNVSGNQLTGSIPALTGLANLQEFIVQANQLTGSIPALTALARLSIFDVANNQLTGPVPEPPSPSSLVNGGSNLCPNRLTISTSTFWDKATGSTPWSAGCTSTPLLAISSGGIANAASYDATAVAPGSLAVVFGVFTGTTQATASSLPWPTTLSGLSVKFNNVAAPLYYASANQVNVHVPWEMAGVATAAVTVTVNGQTSPPQAIAIASMAPGVFQYGDRQAVATDALSAKLITTANPAHPGTTYLTMYCTGLGLATNQPASGVAAAGSPLSWALLTPTVTIGGVPTNPLFAGLTPGLIGVYQINVQVPAGTPVGDSVPLIVSVAGKPAATVSVVVQ